MRVTEIYDKVTVLSFVTTKSKVGHTVLISIWTIPKCNKILITERQQNELCAKRRLRSVWVSTNIYHSIRCTLDEKLRPLGLFKRLAKTVIRLGTCSDSCHKICCKKGFYQWFINNFGLIWVLGLTVSHINESKCKFMRPEYYFSWQVCNTIASWDSLKLNFASQSKNYE